MKIITKNFYLLSLCAVFVTLTAAFALDDESKKQDKAKLGEKAPGFELLDTNDQSRSLSSYKDKIIILEWTNPECEFVSNCYRTKAMQNAYAEVKKIDKTTAWIAINSTPRATAVLNKFWIQKYNIKYPILLDHNGAVAKMYNARRSPFMVVIDKQGIIRYQGALDNNNLMNKKPEQITNYVVNAVKNITDGESVAPDSIKPYGCAIKH